MSSKSENTPISAQALFDQALERVQNESHTEAIALWEHILTQGYSSPDLHANLARAYLENSQAGDAVFHYEQALLHERSSLGLRREVNYARSQVAGSQGTQSASLAEYAHSTASWIRPAEWASLASVLLLVALFMKVFKARRPYIWTALISAFALICLWGLLSLTPPIALVRQDSTLRSSPLHSAENQEKVFKGARVELLRESGDFSEIRRTDQFRGWIPTQELNVLRF